MIRRLLLVFLLALGSCSGDSTDQGGGGTPGETARDFLAADTYTSLVVEIQAMAGYLPTQSAQDNLKTFLEARLNKPGGVTFSVDPEIPAQGKGSYSIDDIKTIEGANRKLYRSGSQIVAYFLFVDGASSSDTSSLKTLGHAYGSSSMVLYEGTIQSMSGTPVTQPSTAVLESTVILHEMGHILGLVNIGSSPQTSHHDSDHGAHCTNTNCLMYYLADTGDIVANLLGGAIPSLDSACVQDLQANGGK
jgi:hypothetical protein